MRSERWTVEQMPDQRGKIVAITGANSGVGFESARALGGKGARVVMAVRDVARGQAAAETIRREHTDARLDVLPLDLADLDAVRRFATEFARRYERLDVLLNNAGVMALPYRRTVDGFEMQFGTNHLGHFALTALLVEPLVAARGARVVTVSSGLHLQGRIDFENLDGARGYDRYGAYAQSKLANLLFAYELQRRFEAGGIDALSAGAHPGYTATNLFLAAPRMERSWLREALFAVGNRVFAQSAAMGALPLLYAATAPGVNGCDYVGPTGPFGLWGSPGKVRSSARSYDVGLAQRLWRVSEELTGVRFEVPASARSVVASQAIS